MQILYWHLTRPQSSTCSGSLSPPLLQRQDNRPSLSTTGNKFSQESTTVQESEIIRQLFHQDLNQIFLRNSSLLADSGRDAGKHNKSNSKAMEIENDDQMPTFYLLNSIDLPEDEDTALNHHLDLIHGRHQNNNDNSYNVSQMAVGNGSSGDGGGGGGGPPGGGHYSDQSRKASNKRKKRRSNDLARVLSIEEESDEDDDAFVNIGPSKSKKAKLVVNLYPEDQGYSFGYQLPGSNECSESHAIPYSERYLLDSIDHEQIPHKVLCKYEDRQGIYLMRYHNQVIAEIRDYRKVLPSISDSNSSSNEPQRSSANRINNNNNNTSAINGIDEDNGQNKKPVVRQVMLRPTTESLLCDFDILVEKGQQDKGGWNAVLRQSALSGDSSHLITDGSDSEYEYEVDLEASQKSHCNSLNYEQRLELERQFVNQTAGPLCLDPSSQVSLIANRMQYEKFKWNTEELKSAAKRWEEDPFKTHKFVNSVPDLSATNSCVTEARLNIEPFLNFVLSIRAKKEMNTRAFGTVDKEPLKIPLIPYQDYADLESPKNIEEILRIGQTPEPAQLRVFPHENFVRKVEEYVLETERRKRPHTTTLSIFQRNGTEFYFGELEMESFLDPNQPRIGTAPSSTKCQFDLGSIRNVSLYVKQFSDIFTEDGRRPCKITYQKVGQPPQVVYTNSYKSASQASQQPVVAAGANTSTSSTQSLSSQNATTVATSVPQSVTLVTTSVSHAPVNSTTPASITCSSPMVIATSAPHVVQTVVSASPVVTVPAGLVSAQPSQQAQLHRPPTTFAAGSAPSTLSSGAPQATTTAPSLPPVQIVHPQPRTNPQVHQQQQQQKSQQTTGQRQTIQVFTQQASQTQINVPTSQVTTQPTTNVNLNLTPQQVLTRPVVNMNLQNQQQIAAQQQLLQFTQQRILRMKQQQQPPVTLTKLLLNSPVQSKPITVAVQPTPQTPTNTTAQSATTGNMTSAVCSSGSVVVTTVAATSDSCSGTTNAPGGVTGNTIEPSPNNPLGSPIMIQSPPSVSSAITNPSPNVNVSVNTSPNVSVNLNAISLDSLLAASSANVNYGHTATTLTTNQASGTGGNLVAASNVNLGLSRITTSSGQPAVNILRLNNSTGNAVATAAGGNTVQLAAVQRQFAALNGNVSILQQGRPQPQQRILINANSVNAVNNLSEVDELSVPDLTTLLGGQPIQISQLGQQQHILTNAGAQVPSQTTIDTTNLNLNLNVNLNSGAMVNSGDSQVQQHQIAKIQGGEWTTTGQTPPFLVFISPLRPMSIATSAGSAVTRQITSSTGSGPNSSTLNLNLGAVQQSQSHQPQIVQSQPGKIPEGPTRILLGTCNNGVAIKREVATSSASSATHTIIASSVGTGSGVGENVNHNQSQVVETGSNNVEGQLLEAQHVVANNDVVVDGVDSLFHALSEAIGPEQLQKLDAISGTLATSNNNNLSSIPHNGQSIPSSAGSGIGTMVDTAAGINVNVVPSDVTTSSIQSSISAISNSNNAAKNTSSTNVITLSDLLGSPAVVSSSTGNVGPSFPSLILSSVSNSSSTVLSSPTLSSLLNSSTGVGHSSSLSSQSISSTGIVTQSSIVSSTPRLSALLAGTPSADTILVGTNGASSIVSTVDSSTGATGESSGGAVVNSASYGNLLDRLAARLNQPQGTTAQVRTGASRLNPIATATPSVVLEHPVLAATLTQQQQQQIPGSPTTLNRGAPAFRQIAPAPSTAGQSVVTTTTSIGSNSSSNVTVISSSDFQSQASQSPQLINLLGLVGNNATTGAASPARTRTVRISTTSSTANPSSGSNSR